jgi:hypothetical protein
VLHMHTDDMQAVDSRLTRSEGLPMCCSVSLSSVILFSVLLRTLYLVSIKLSSPSNVNILIYEHSYSDLAAADIRPDIAVSNRMAAIDPRLT